VNFFGHAVVATWRSRADGFVLGAMLPDFAGMIGSRPPRVTHDEVDRGIEFHHETDRVFHDSPTFRALQSDARRTLRNLGLPRPSALAVAHIGVEIVLDSSLARDLAGRDSYGRALTAGRHDVLGSHIEWSDESIRDRFQKLRAALEARGVPSGASDASTVAWRVARALEGRPRFRLDPEGERIVQAWAEGVTPIVANAADSVVAELRSGLGF
jgi:hypothetical protein